MTEYAGDPETAWIGIGQSEDLITPYAMMRYVAAIANGGMLVRPHIIYADTVTASRLIEESTADRLKELMINNVEKGYGSYYTFPDLKIGGPSYCRIQGTKTYFPQFFQYMRDNEVPIDFVSWHKYGAEPSVYLMEADLIRGWMKEYGYADAELILNEWNYRRFKEGSGSSNERYNRLNRRSMKGAAFVAATMSALQDAPVDMLMYYDFRANSNYCGFYDYQTQAHKPVYYAFYAWSKLAGNQCAVSVDGGAGDIYAVASVQDGKTTLLLTRYDGDNNACNLAKVRVSLSGRSLGKVLCHLTDFEHLYTEIPLFPSEDGQVSIDLWNNSVAILAL